MDMLQEDQDTLERLKAKYNNSKLLQGPACLLDTLLAILKQALPALSYLCS
jgi:hypothetical protein